LSQSIDLRAAKETFIAEAREMLQQLEDGLLALENAPDDADTMGSVFRAAHTVKGSAGLFEFDRIVSFMHLVENILDRARDGKLALTSDLIALLLECNDQAGALVEEVSENETTSEQYDRNTERSAELTRRLRQAADGGLTAAPVAAGGRATVAPDAELESSGGAEVGSDNWHISLRFGRDVLRNGMDPLSFIRYLGTLGKIVHLVTLADAMPPAEEMDPESCYLGFEISFKSGATRQAIADAFEFVRDDCKIHILPPHGKIADYVALIQALPGDPMRLGEILTQCGSLTAEELDQALAQQRSGGDTEGAKAPLGEMLVQQKMVQPAVVEAALKKQEKVKEAQVHEARFIRVRADKLDDLINLVGELVVAGAGINLRAQKSGDSGLFEATSTLNELVEEIRGDAMQLRMVQIAETFSRFNRVVRDTSKELGKQVQLKITGAENELDKSMVEKLVDPLMHLVRNSMDHGIETPEVRLAAGKPAEATLSLTAYLDSGAFIIEVGDDGAGLNRERIHAKAVERGLIAKDEALSEQEIYNLVFEAGFSTAEKVTNLSGRGVGMDVVKRNIQSLRGNVSIASQPGRGTTVTMRLPLTLAIIDGFLVRSGGDHYVVPLDMVVECIELPAEKMTGAGADGQGDYLNLRGEVLPYLRLREMFGGKENGGRRRRESVVVVRALGQKAGLVVDALLGEFHTVIKPLGQIFRKLRGISDATILGSGEVALVVDVQTLVADAAGKGAKRAGTQKLTAAAS
jgi:two-component system chemotaxis sensor kinase CheA